MPDHLASPTTGQRIARWVWTGGEHQDLVNVTVVRVNRRTVTVRYDDGHTVRVNPVELTEAYPDD